MNISRKQWLMQLNLQLFVFQRLGCQVQVRSVSSHWETKLEASVWCSQFPPDNSRRKGTWKSWGLQSRQKLCWPWETIGEVSVWPFPSPHTWLEGYVLFLLKIFFFKKITFPSKWFSISYLKRITQQTRLVAGKQRTFHRFITCQIQISSLWLIPARRPLSLPPIRPMRYGRLVPARSPS